MKLLTTLLTASIMDNINRISYHLDIRQILLQINIFSHMLPQNLDFRAVYHESVFRKDKYLLHGRKFTIIIIEKG